MQTVHAIMRSDRLYAISPTHEDAMTLIARLEAAGQGSGFGVKPMPIVTGDLQPQRRLTIEARITDTQEIFVRQEDSHLFWPVTQYPMPAANWQWGKYDWDKYGTLIVQGFDEEKVRELFKATSETFRLDQKMFSQNKMSG